MILLKEFHHIGKIKDGAADAVKLIYNHPLYFSCTRGAEWNTARLSELLRNPVYVQADIEIYRFFKSQG